MERGGSIRGDYSIYSAVLVVTWFVAPQHKSATEPHTDSESGGQSCTVLAKDLSFLEMI